MLEQIARTESVVKTTTQHNTETLPNAARTEQFFLRQHEFSLRISPRVLLKLTF